MGTPIFYLRPHFSEMIASFMMVLGLLLVWVFIKRKDHVFSSAVSRRVTGAGLSGLVVAFGLVAGLAIQTGHSWGNPAYGVTLGIQHTYRLFTNDSSLLLIGILYLVFEFVGGGLAFGVFCAFIWFNNFFTTDQTKVIRFTEIFKWERTVAPKGFILDALGSFMVAFALLGASNFAQEPKGWPVSDTAIITNILLTSLVTMLAISLIGIRGILTLNPLTWAMAFVIKFSTSLYLNRKSITGRIIIREMISPVAVLGAAAAAGLLVSLILSLPHNPVPGA